MASNEPKPSTQPPIFRFRAAYEQLLPEMEQVPDVDLIHINTDIAAAVTTALGAWPEIAAARGQIEKGLPGFDLVAFDKLELYALAAGHAHTRYIVAKAPVASLPEVAEQGQRTREVLHSDARVLAKRGLIDASNIKELRSTNGYRDIAFDLFALVHLMRESWGVIAGKTAVQLAELDAAEQLAERLVAEVGQREQGPAAIAAATLNRQRAYTLFFRTYDQVRRALSYLRWKEEDVDEVAPSLFAGRGGRGREPEVAAPATQPAPSATPSANAAPVASTPTTAPQAVGLPNSPAFTR